MHGHALEPASGLAVHLLRRHIVIELLFRTSYSSQLHVQR